MKFNYLVYVGIMIVLLIFILTFVSALTDKTWYTNTTINASLPDVGARSAPTVFNLSGTLYMLAGQYSTDKVFGFKFTPGSGWAANSTINNSFTFPDAWPTPRVFSMDGALTNGLIGANNGYFYGYTWNPSTSAWVVNNTVNASLGTIGTNLVSIPNVFKTPNGEWYLLSSSVNGNWFGFHWDAAGSHWDSNTTIKTGLPVLAGSGAWAANSFYMEGSLYMLVGGGDPIGTLFGFVWDTTNNHWDTNTTINNSLPTGMGKWPHPAVFNYSEINYMISGHFDGNFYGFTYYLTPPVTNCWGTSGKMIYVPAGCEYYIPAGTIGYTG